MRIPICVLLALAPLAASTAPEVSHGPRQLGLEVLEELAVRDGKYDFEKDLGIAGYCTVAVMNWVYEIELSPSASTDSAAIPARPTAPALKIDDPYRYALSYQIENLKWHAGRSGLVDGMRPERDLPPEDRKIFGCRLSDGDWLLLQGESGIWVTGVPAPPAAVPVVVHGIFEDAAGGVRLKASHIFKDGGRLGHLRHDIRRGERIYFELPGARSVICPVEIAGDCVRAAFLDETACVILEAVKPGSATVTVYELFRLDDQRKKIGRFEISVHD